MAKTKPAKRFANFWTQKWKGKDDHRIQKVWVFFFSLGIFGGWGSVGEEYQDFWNRIHFLDFSASLGLAFQPTGTGGQVEQRTSKPFGLHQFGELGGFGGFEWPQDMWRTPNGWWYCYGIFIYLLMLFHQASETFTPIHNSCQKAGFFSKNRGKKCTILFNMTVSATLQKNKSYSPPGSLSPMAAPMHTTSGWDFCWHKSTCFQGQQKQIPKRMSFNMKRA